MVVDTVVAGSQVHPAAGTICAAVEELADVGELADVEDQTAVDHPTAVLVPSPVEASEGEAGTARIGEVD